MQHQADTIRALYMLNFKSYWLYLISSLYNLGRHQPLYLFHMNRSQLLNLDYTLSNSALLLSYHKQAKILYLLKTFKIRVLVVDFIRGLDITVSSGDFCDYIKRWSSNKECYQVFFISSNSSANIIVNNIVKSNWCISNLFSFNKKRVIFVNSEFNLQNRDFRTNFNSLTQIALYSYRIIQPDELASHSYCIRSKNICLRYFCDQGHTENDIFNCK